MIDAQKRLEEEHRREEDKLLTEFQKERTKEVTKLSEELKQEWEVKLRELTDRFDKDMAKNKKKLKDSEKKVRAWVEIRRTANKRPKGPHILHLSTMCQLLEESAKADIFVNWSARKTQTW